jgi:hypothetical protein
VIDNGLVPPVFFVLQNGSFTAFNGAYPPAASVAAAASTGLFRALDLDGDGLVDFVRIGSDGSTLVLRQTSLLNFATATLSPPIPGAGQFVETFADADADGDLDAVAYDAVAHAFRLYRRFGLAFVADPATLLPPLPNGGTYLGVAAWDADGDGAREFVVAFEPSAPPTTVLPPPSSSSTSPRTLREAASPFGRRPAAR